MADEKDKEQTEAEKTKAIRDSITVETNQKEQDERDKLNASEKSEGDEEEKDVEADEEGEVEAKTEKEENEEEIEKSEKSEEDLEAEKAAAKTQREKDRIQKRIDKEVAKRKALEKENADLKRKLEVKPDGEKVLTEEDVETRSELKARQKQAEREFANACDKLFKDAVKVDKEFKAKVDTMAEDIGPIPGIMIGILDDLDNGGEVLSYLTNNVEMAEEIYELTEGKMGRRLQKISDEIEAAKKPKPKPISKAPKPNEPIGGNRVTPTILRDNMPMDEWVKLRSKQAAEHYKQKRGLS